METIQYKGHTIRLERDEDPQNPREDENVGEILYTSGRYNLGDRRVEAEEIKAITERKDVIWLPVYAYIHSCTRLSTKSFIGRAHHAEWDSGQCGIIWCTKDKAVKEWGKTRCTKKVIAAAEKYLAGEVETFDQYLNGEIVGCTIEGPLCEDSCWGYYPDEKGNYDYAISEAKSTIDYARKKEAKRLREERKQSKLEQEQHLALI